MGKLLNFDNSMPESVKCLSKLFGHTTDLLVVRLLWSECIVDRLEIKIKMRKIVQPVCPPWGYVVLPYQSHLRLSDV